MASTKYVVSFWINQQEEAAFRSALGKYHGREHYTTDYHLEVVSVEEKPVTGASREVYLEVTLSCTDVLALFKFGEFWGNKTQQRWAKEEKAQQWPRKGGKADG